MNIGVGRITVTVRAVSGIFFGVLYILFLDNLLLFDHAVSAVFAGINALFSGSTAAGTVFKIFDLCSGDLLFGLRAATESGTLIQYQFDQFYKKEYRYTDKQTE